MKYSQASLFLHSTHCLSTVPAKRENKNKNKKWREMTHSQKSELHDVNSCSGEKGSSATEREGTYVILDRERKESTGYSY